MTSRHYSSDAKEVNILVVVDCFKTGLNLGDLTYIAIFGKTVRCSFNSFEQCRILLQLVIGGMTSVAHFIAGHKQTQLNRVCFFVFFGVFLASKISNFSDLIYIILTVQMIFIPLHILW